MLEFAQWFKTYLDGRYATALVTNGRRTPGTALPER